MTCEFELSNSGDVEGWATAALSPALCCTSSLMGLLVTEELMLTLVADNGVGSKVGDGGRRVMTFLKYHFRGGCSGVVAVTDCGRSSSLVPPFSSGGREGGVRRMSFVRLSSDGDADR